MRRRWQVLVVLSAVVTAAAGVLLAHELTVRGTVGAVERARIQVKPTPVADKAPEKPAWYPIDEKTVIKRGENAVTFDEAKIKVDERVAIIVDHPDKGPMKTKEIRLVAK